MCLLPQKSSIKLDAAIPNLKYSGGLVGDHNYALYVGDPDRNNPGIILWDGPRATQWTGIDAVADFGDVGGWGGALKNGLMPRMSRRHIRMDSTRYVRPLSP